MLVLGLIDLPLWLIVVILICVSFYLYTERQHSIFRRYGIPGTKPWPLIGGLVPVLRKGLTELEYEGTQTYGKCFGIHVGNAPVLIITDTELIKEVFVKQFTSYPTHSQMTYKTKFWEDTVLLSEDYAHWKILRSTLSPSFTGGKLKKMNSILLNCVDDMINILKQTNSGNGVNVDVMPIYRSLSLDVICRTAFGLEVNTQTDIDNEFVNQLKKLAPGSINQSLLLFLYFLAPAFKHVCSFFDLDTNDTKAINTLAKMMKPVIEERKKEKSHGKVDLLQLMINANQDDANEPGKKDKPKDGELERRALTDSEIMANALVFLVAGSETTATALIFASYFLATEPDCQEKLIKEVDETLGKSEPTYETVQRMEYLEMFLSEVMRLYPPATRTNRHIETDAVINGVRFPKGISVAIPFYTLHRMEEYWKEPLKFDPERFSEKNKGDINPYAYMPFGVGPRMCIGTRFAQMEMKMTLVRVLQNFRFKPSAELQIPPKLKKTVFCVPEGGMPLVLERRSTT